MVDKSDFKALVRIIALLATNDPSEAEKAVEWAYSGQEKQKRGAAQKKVDKVDPKAVERIYNAYPASTVRAEGNRVPLRSSKDKEKIARLLQTKSEEELIENIKKYVEQTDPKYLRMLSTYLSNIPDFTEQKQEKVKEHGCDLFDDPEILAIFKERRK